VRTHPQMVSLGEGWARTRRRLRWAAEGGVCRLFKRKPGTPHSEGIRIRKPDQDSE
jgi:hypothetical protein